MDSMQEEGIQVQSWRKTSTPGFISAIVVNFILSLSLHHDFDFYIHPTTQDRQSLPSTHPQPLVSNHTTMGFFLLLYTIDFFSSSN
jgi:hypothetical protein